MFPTRENLNIDFAAGLAGGIGGGRLLLATALCALLAGCSTNSVKNIWETEELGEVLPEGEPFSLRCTAGGFIIVRADGGPRPDFALSYARAIQDDSLLKLNYDGGESAVLDVQDGKTSNWSIGWSKRMSRPNETANSIYFHLIDGRGRLDLELITDFYQGHAPLFALEHSAHEGKGEYGGEQKISEEFYCMRVADIAARKSP